MDPLLDKLLDLVVTILGVVIGGGLITAFIEVRRHRREKEIWQREDEMLQIDIPRADMMVIKWRTTDKMSDSVKVKIYENKLTGTVKTIFVVVEFVIHNTTGRELFIHDYDASIASLPTGEDRKTFYDLETSVIIPHQNRGNIKLKPNETLPRMLIIESAFDENRRLDAPPQDISILVKTSSGVTIPQTKDLNSVRKFHNLAWWKNGYHPKKYVDQMKEIEAINKADEIPF